MKLPVQAPAVVRGSFSWPTRRTARGSTEPAIVPSGSAIIRCSGDAPNACICDNGIATCCRTTAGCSIDSLTGACNCTGEIR